MKWYVWVLLIICLVFGAIPGIVGVFKAIKNRAAAK